MLNDLWILLSGIMVFIGLVASEGLLLVVGSLVIVLAIAARIWDRYAFRPVSHSRSINRRRVFICDTVDYTVSLDNDKLLPLIGALGTSQVYSPGTLDQIPKQVSGALMFGGALVQPLADLDRTDYLVIIGSNPVVRAASIPSSTLETSPFSPLISLKTASSKLSRLMVIRFKPAALSSSARSASKVPLVVRARSSPRNSFSALTISTISRRRRGSPPVTRSFVTPSCINNPAIRLISPGVSQWRLGRNSYPSP